MPEQLPMSYWCLWRWSLQRSPNWCQLSQPHRLRWGTLLWKVTQLALRSYMCQAPHVVLDLHRGRWVRGWSLLLVCLCEERWGGRGEGRLGIVVQTVPPVLLLLIAGQHRVEEFGWFIYGLEDAHLWGHVAQRSVLRLRFSLPDQWKRS